MTFDVELNKANTITPSKNRKTKDNNIEFTVTLHTPHCHRQTFTRFDRIM